MKVSELKQYVHGAVFDTITRTTFDNLIVNLPSLEIQKSISSDLGAIDKKIQLNQQINQTLEEMGQALFKSWFVDFEPTKAKIEALEAGGNEEDANLAAMQVISGKTVAELEQLKTQNPENYQQLHTTAQHFPAAMQESELGEIPEGWEVGLLAELCLLNPENWSSKTLPDVVNYVDLANTKNGEIVEIQTVSGQAIPSRARRILRKGDTIIGTVRPGNKSFSLIGSDNLTGSTGFVVLRPIKQKWLEFVYLVATSNSNIERLAHLADGGAYPAVKPEVVVQESVVIPNENIVFLFHSFVEPFFYRIIINKKQNNNLSELRDILLPKLLSGELSIADLSQMEFVQ